MDDDGMEYPDEDLDLMIDEELEIERELEMERRMEEQLEKENRGPSPPHLAKANVSPRALRATDCNVGLPTNTDVSGKRARSQGDKDDENFPSGENGLVLYDRATGWIDCYATAPR